MPKVGPEQVIDAIIEVRDPDIEASEYDFLDEIGEIHPKPAKKGNDGLANWIANLAIFQVDNHLVIDEGLIEEADSILTEQHNTGNSRSRIEGIVKNSDIRPGKKKSMVGNHLGGDNDIDGHARLLEMVSDFYAEGDLEEDLENTYKDKGLLLECDNMTGGNILGLDPATGLKVAVDALDEYLSEDKASDYTVIPVHGRNSFSSKPENNQHNEGGENMALGDRLETLEYAQEDHYDAAERMDRALEEHDDARDAATAVAEEFADVFDLQGQAAEVATNAMTDYLLDHRSYMDDKTVELLENAEETREALDGLDVPDYDNMMDAIHVAARIERKTEEEYDFNF